jgi:hypothetical protein
MRDVTSCADNLVLFGEMLEVASDYINRCEETLGHEEAFMVELARGQIYFLRQRLAKLDHRLHDLEVQLCPNTQAAKGK